MKKIISQLEANPDVLTRHFISVANYTYLKIYSGVQDTLENEKPSIFLENIEKLTFDSVFQKNVNVIGAVEASLEILNTILNFIRHHKSHNKNLANTEDALEATQKAWILSNIYSNIKEAYDSAIWEGGYIRVSPKDKEIHIRYKDEHYALFKKIGIQRLEANALSFSLIGFEMLQLKSEALREISRIGKFRHFRKRKRIKSLEVINGNITYQLCDGEDESLLLEDTALISSLIAFYDFLGDEELPELHGLSIKKVLTLFSEFRHLINQAINKVRLNPKNLEVTCLDDFKALTFSIKISDLRRYLSSKTIFNTKQINEFLKLLEFCEAKDIRYNLWRKPLIKQKDFYIFTLLGICNSNIIYLIDEWLEIGGFSIDKRGYLFEDYIKKTLVQELSKKGFYHHIPQRKNFSSGGKTEEIDLILITKRSILLAEVKCIKFPMDPRRSHDALKRLSEGAHQINRKASFFLENINSFKDDLGSIENKRIVKVVITNFPVFSGLKFDGVPIIDFFLLDAYINSGALRMATFPRNKRVFDEEEHLTTRFYTTENEFSEKLGFFLENPPAIKRLQTQFVVQDHKISSSAAEFSMYIQTVNTTENITLRT